MTRAGSTKSSSAGALDALAQWYEQHSTAADDDDWVDVEPVEDPTTVRSVRLRRSTVDGLAAAARARGIGPTELMREWIEERLEAETDPSTELARLLWVQEMADALVRHAGIPGLRVEMRADVRGFHAQREPQSAATSASSKSPRAAKPAATKKSSAGRNAAPKKAR